MARWSRLRSGLRSLVASRAELEAADERRRAVRSGCTAVQDLRDRAQVEVFGVLRNVTFHPRGETPALEAELFDGTGSVHIVWLGQREIAGIGPGRRVRLQGRVAMEDGRALLYNPRYTLMPKEVE